MLKVLVSHVISGVSLLTDLKIERVMKRHDAYLEIQAGIVYAFIIFAPLME